MNAKSNINTHKMADPRTLRCGAVFFVLIAALLAALALNIGTGNVSISPSDIMRILLTGSGDQTEVSIILSIRLPRALMAAILGGALALSGFLLQTFFGNPIAGPFVLGISSGARMVVALTMIFFLNYIGFFSSWALILSAFAGALISTGFILLISERVPHMASLLVAGIMIGYICSAITDFVITFADDADIVNLHGWTQGSFSGMSWENVWMAALLVAVAFIFTFMLSKPMSAYQLGEDYARNLGVNISAFRMELIALSSILSACVTAFAGPVAFVGIAVPYLARQAFGTSRPLVIIPGSFLAGAVFCLFCDLCARMAFAPTELAISTVTSITGAPVVIYMLIRREGRKR